MGNDSNHPIYSKNVIEFITVANEYCKFVETALDNEKHDFIGKSLKMLSLLYLKASLLPKVDYILDEGNEKFVTEFEWQLIKNNISTLLENDDMYVDFFDSNMEEAPEPVSNFISENLADIYQDLKDFLSIYQIMEPNLMNDALAECAENFSSYWGYRVVNSMRILHWLQNKDIDTSKDSSDEDSRTSNNPLYRKIGK